MRKRTLWLILSLVLVAVIVAACAPLSTPEPQRESGMVEQQRQLTENLADQVRAELIQKYGYAIEPHILAARTLRTNNPAHVAYIYFVSTYTGEVLFQATAVGKVASTTKRLDPPQSYVLSDSHDCGESHCTDWLLFDRVGADGSYGHSVDGVVWFDTAGIMHEVKLVGGVFPLIEERPYVFPEGQRVDLMVDIRLQVDGVDSVLDAQRISIEEWIKSNPDWRPGDEIPLHVLTGEGS